MKSLKNNTFTILIKSYQNNDNNFLSINFVELKNLKILILHQIIDP